ncbi:MAG: VIT and vWA domain-containing protein [bacterium]
MSLGLLVLSQTVLAAGLMTPTDGSVPAMEIRDHQVSVVIEDGYAITTVEQVFHNPNPRDLEAFYSFPVPENGMVAEFTVWIDGKPVTGEVLEKQQARQVYEQEKQAGREAGIAEQDSYKTFDIRVQPVRAGQQTRTRLVYMQAAHVDTGIGRYVYPLQEGGTDEEKLAFWTANDQVTGRFSFDLQLRSAYPVAAVRVPAHPSALVQNVDASNWSVELGNGAVTAEGESQQNPSAQVVRLDQDIVVYWRHQAGLPGSVDLMTYKPDAKGRGTFMMVVTPGEDLQAIKGGRDWVFVLDISGSMQGKYQTLVDGVQKALGKLTADDRFRIVLFNNRSRELTPGYVNATASLINEYASKVAAIQPDQGTNLYAGLKEGLDAMDADRTSSIVLVTDGVANVGETQQRKFIDLVRKKDVRLFTFVMGNSANRPMLEAMTDASGGFAISISNSDDIAGQLLNAVSKVSHQALHGVKLKIDGVKTADLSPEAVGSLYRGQQLVLFGHYWGEGDAEVALTGKISGSPKSYATRFPFPGVANDNPEIERLWAYAKIADLQREMDNFGEKPDLKQAATDIALEYSLVTDYTSMVVLREEQYAQQGIERRNHKRLAIEQVAQQQRAAKGVTSRRVDSQQPMYQGSRASYGAGAVSPWFLLVLLFLAWLAARARSE